MVTDFRVTPTTRLQLPWTATVAGLIAIAMLYITAGMPLTLPIFALILLGTFATPQRLTKPTWAPWILRIFLWVLIVVLNPDKFADMSSWFFDGRFAIVSGMGCAAEIVVRFWAGYADRSKAVPIIFWSGATMLSASNTGDNHLIPYVMPVYFAFLAWSMPQFRAVPVMGEKAAALAWRIAALVLALGLGFGTYNAFWSHRSDLMKLGNNMLQNRQMPESTGTSTDPVLGQTFGLRSTTQRVLRIEGLSGISHLRGMTFDTYSLGHWKPTLNGQHFGPIDADQLKPNVRGHHALVIPLAEVHGLIFRPLQVAGLNPMDNSELEYDPRADAYHVQDDPPSTYQIIDGNDGSVDEPRAVSSVSTLTPLQQTRTLDVPKEIASEVHALAHKIADQYTDPVEKIEAIQGYLIQHHSYSMTYIPPPGDPVSGFILADKSAAHCEFFASSAVILMRCAGIPARYVTGYYAHESEGPHTTVVRQRDAHAWAEAWTPKTGWVMVDATPGGGRPDGSAESIPVTQRWSERFQDALGAARRWLQQFTPQQIILTVGGVIALYFFLRWLWRLRHQHRTKEEGFQYSLRDADLATLATRFEAYLRRHNLRCPPGRTWQELIASAATDPEQPLPPESITRADEFVSEYNGVRFGPDEAHEEELSKLRNILQTLEKQGATR